MVNIAVGSREDAQATGCSPGRLPEELDFEVRMRAKTSSNADRIELRELTELLEEALGEREPSEAPGSE
jgi:hypothetical protein